MNVGTGAQCAVRYRGLVGLDSDMVDSRLKGGFNSTYEKLFGDMPCPISS